MLILTRRPGESVKIGDEITVTVLGIRGNQLRLGFTAPQHVSVHREEVYRRIQAEKPATIPPAGIGNPPLRPGERSLESSSESGVSYPRVVSIVGVRDPSAQRHAGPSPGRRHVKLSPQTKKELSKW